MRRAVVLLLVLLVAISVIPLLPDNQVQDEGLEVENATRATRTVGPGKQYSKIMDAVYFASAGDTIKVYPKDYGAAYSERVILEKQLTLIGMNPSNTTVSGGLNRHCISITVDSCVVTGMRARASGPDKAGLRLESSFNIIRDCHFGTSHWGLRLYPGAENNTFVNCTFEENDYGVLQAGTNTTLINCTFINNTRVGLDLRGADTSLYGSDFHNCGVFINGSKDVWTNQDIPGNNTVNGKALVFHSSGTSLVVASAGQVVLSGCDSITVKDIDLSNSSYGVCAGYCSNLFIENCVLRNNTCGVYVENTDTATIEELNTSRCLEAGVRISYSKDIELREVHSNRTIEWDGAGLEILESNGCMGYDCSASNGPVGMRLEGVSNSVFYNTTFDLNDLYGAHLIGSDNDQFHFLNASYDKVGVLIENSQSLEFEYCLLYHCGFVIESDQVSGWDTHMFSEVQVNDRAIVYAKGMNGGSTSQFAGQLILANCQNVDVRQANVSNCSIGIQLGFSDSNTIHYNYAQNNSVAGVRLYGSDENILNANFLSENYNGFELLDSDDNNAGGNNLSGNVWSGGLLQRSDTNTIRGNTVSMNYQGLYFQDSVGNSLELNDVDGNSWTGVVLDNCTGGRLEENELHNNVDGARLIDCEGILITDTDAYDNTGHGMVIEDGCTACKVQNGTFMDNGASGTWVWWAEGTTLANNTYTSNDEYGIRLLADANTTISNNQITQNPIGVGVYESSLDEVLENSLTNNDIGIKLGAYANNNTIHHNIFSLNVHRAVRAYLNTALNRIYLNDFLNNNQTGGLQCLDNGTGNIWDTGRVGNHWSDHTGPDADLDGVVDTPYVFNIPLDNKDRYPLADPVDETDMDPHLLTNDILEVYEDVPFWQVYDAWDLDNPVEELEWYFESNASWLSFSQQNLSGVARNEEVGTYWVRIAVGDGQAFDETNFTLTVHNTNDAPVINGTDELEAYEGEMYSVQYSATDIDPTNDTFSWTLGTDAAFLDIDENGLVTGMPMNSDVGRFWVNVTVRDGQNGTDSRNFTLDVYDVNNPPEAGMDHLEVEFNEDGVYWLMFDGMFTDPDGDVIEVSISSVENVSAHIAPNGSLRISAEPDLAGFGHLGIVGSDGIEEASVQVNVTIRQVNDPPVNPVIKAKPKEVLPGDMVSLSGSAEDVDLVYGDVLNFTWSSNISGELGSGETLEVELVEGMHLVTLTVSDTEGASVWASTLVLVTPGLNITPYEPPVDDDDDIQPNVTDDDDVEPPVEDDDDDTGSFGALFWVELVVFIILIIAAIGLLLFIIARKSQAEETIEADETPVRETPEPAEPSVQPSYGDAPKPFQPTPAAQAEPEEEVTLDDLGELEEFGGEEGSEDEDLEDEFDLDDLDLENEMDMDDLDDDFFEDL